SGDLAIWVIFAACLALSFLLSGMESGVFALSRIRIRQQMRAGRSSARLLHSYLENPENFLWTIVVGNTAANFFILGWTIYLLFGAFRTQRVLFVLALAAAVFLFYALFDLLPKMLFRAYPTRLCLALAKPFRFIHILLWPMVALVEAVSDWLLRRTGGKAFKGNLFGNREELRLLMQETAAGFTSEEKLMINRVLDLQSVTVRQVMRPLDQVTTARAEWLVSELLERARHHPFTRLPVIANRDGQNRIIGLANLNSLLFDSNLDPSRPVLEIVRPALYLDEDLRVEIALRRMQRSGQRMAIVLGRDRRESGIITLEDVFRTVFGDVKL
ncbi:MAG TPA: CNNM domain-containing protein, partial [Verrucomicrobiota bacterium]|nr:CNNM domain-containing protein [Verrucomicrobiota bacterium]